MNSLNFVETNGTIIGFCWSGENGAEADVVSTLVEGADSLVDAVS